MVWAPWGQTKCEAKNHCQKPSHLMKSGFKVEIRSPLVVKFVYIVQGSITAVGQLRQIVGKVYVRSTTMFHRNEGCAFGKRKVC